MPREADPNSATQRALALYREGVPVREILRQIDIRESTIYAALRREQAAQTGCCSKCGGPVDPVTGRTTAKNIPNFLRADAPSETPDAAPGVPGFLKRVG